MIIQSALSSFELHYYKGKQPKQSFKSTQFNLHVCHFPLHKTDCLCMFSFSGSLKITTLNSVQRKLCPIAQGQWILLSGQLFLFFTCPVGKCCFFFQETQITEELLIKKGLEMTCGLVQAGYSLPKWQAVKLTFFAPC